MRFNALRTIATAALLCATGAVHAAPQTPGSNVLMTQCDPRPYNNATSGFRATPYKSGQRAILAIQYQNEAATPATAIVFGWSPVGNSSDSDRTMEDLRAMR